MDQWMDGMFGIDGRSTDGIYVKMMEEGPEGGQTEQVTC